MAVIYSSGPASDVFNLKIYSPFYSSYTISLQEISSLIIKIWPLTADILENPYVISPVP